MVAGGPQQKVVYAAWFEGLLVRSLAPRLTPQLRVSLKEIGLDLENRLADHYPAAVRLECVRLLRQHVFGELTNEQAWLSLGHASGDGFLQTAVGKAFGVLFRLLGPRAVMKRAGNAAAAATNYVNAEATERGPFIWQVRLEGADLDAAYYRGLILSVLATCGAESPRVELVSHADAPMVLDCSWAPPRRIDQ